jgi:uncharacterized protein with PQ loop repeat
LSIAAIFVSGCEHLVVRDSASLLVPTLQRSELVGFIAGLGTTCAALPDLIGMLRRRSSAGINPRMATIMGVFQIVWIYYGLLILSRPVIAWNVLAVLINFLSVGAYYHFLAKERNAMKAYGATKATGT